ncbi:LOW QUALITY PROTEIN: porimin [Sinocyclocheilus rhinocerous]|uniref:LOW QUALITY PROTEIN: porimin n=1 Tax=Sinocyclocheilus rhinocerous TaxID=307959 RepID=UPI0007B88E7F|nr:PREDICTED: LOW QUALITY PROTEIN: porimin-like [Sinocyclocheilus rhinocerous]
MNRCLCFIFINSCLLLLSDSRADQAHSAEGETSVTRSNMSNYSTLLPKAEHITPTEPSVNTVHISTESKHLISACTGVPPSIPTAGPRFHAGSFIGGMMLAIIIILVVTLGYRLACSQRDMHYRVIEEHDAII